MEEKINKSTRPSDLYEYTMSVLQNGKLTDEIEIYWQKIHFKHLGQQGVSELRYNFNNGRFEPRVDVNHWDNTCWLKPITNASDFQQTEETNQVFDGTTRTRNFPILNTNLINLKHETDTSTPMRPLW